MQLKKIYIRSNELSQLAQGRDGMVSLMGSSHPFPGSIPFEIVQPANATAEASEDQMELPINKSEEGGADATIN